MQIPPQPSTRLAWLSRWWDKGVAYRIALIAVIPLLGICICCSAGIAWLASPAGQQAVQEAQATETAQASAAATSAALHPTPTRSPAPTSTASITPTPTATPVSAPTATSAPGGPPYVGGPFSNFPAKYGPPFGHGTGDSDNFYTDSTQTIVINVSPTSGTVTHLGLVGHDSWSDGDTHDYLFQFLPSDATLYNSAGPYTDYHSSVGNLVIGVFGQGTGVVNLAQ